MSHDFPMFWLNRATGWGVLGLCAAICLVITGDAPAQSTLRYDFETTTPSWRWGVADAPLQIRAHQRLRQDAHSGHGCEYLRFMAGHGTFVEVTHPLGEAYVVDELNLRVWIRSNRAGARLMARAVLPRTRHPETGAALTTMLIGSSYGTPGRWQSLALDQIPVLLEREARRLRFELGANVDTREAYVDEIALNIYGGQGETHVWLDDLEVRGFVERTAAPNVPGSPETVPPGSNEGPRHFQPAKLSEPGAAPDAVDHVELRGSIFYADGTPVFPRVVDYRGEPLRFLKELGFNAVKMSSVPSTELLQEADRVGIAIICPPPSLISGSTGETAIGPEFDVVWAWDLGNRLSRAEIDEATRVAHGVRRADPARSRPLICEPATELRSFSRIADILVFDHSPWNPGLDPTAWGTWLEGRSNLTLPGTPFWTVIQTQVPPEILRQWSALAAKPDFQVHPHAPVLSMDLVREQIHQALASGSRGIFFATSSRLDNDDPTSRLRATVLELANTELRLLDPWAAATKHFTTASTSRSGIVGAVLEVARARLVLPIHRNRLGPDRFASGEKFSYTVPGVPAGYRAYELTPAGIFRVRAQERVAGGIRVTLNEYDEAAAVVLAGDGRIYGTLAKRSQIVSRRAVRLERDLVAAHLSEAELVAHRLRAGPVQNAADALLASARADLTACDAFRTQERLREAYRFARRASRTLATYEAPLMGHAVAAARSPVATPFVAALATLPEHRRFLEQVKSRPPQENLLPTGNIENFTQMQASGWQLSVLRNNIVLAGADVSTEVPNQGRFSLRLEAHAADRMNPPTMLESAPVWVTTPPIPVAPGSVIRVDASIRVPVELDASVDGLMVIDSLGGAALAERVQSTEGWQPITLYRAAGDAEQMTLTFALTGLGEASIDDVRVRPLGAPLPFAPPRLPPAVISERGRWPPRR